MNWKNIFKMENFKFDKAKLDAIKNRIAKLRPFDWAVIFIIIAALVVGILTAAGKRMTSSNQIEATTKVEIDVYIRGVIVNSQNNIFETGNESFITIRNVPYTKLKIKRVDYERKKIILPANNANSYKVIDDVTSPFNYDFLVTLEDEAKITKDGAVVGGNKIKIGLPVTLEGVDYRLNGVVSNITLSQQADGNIVNKDIEEQVKENQDVH